MMSTPGSKRIGTYCGGHLRDLQQPGHPQIGDARVAGGVPVTAVEAGAGAHGGGDASLGGPELGGDAAEGGQQPAGDAYRIVAGLRAAVPQRADRGVDQGFGTGRAGAALEHQRVDAFLEPQRPVQVGMAGLDHRGRRRPQLPADRARRLPAQQVGAVRIQRDGQR